MNQLKNHFHIQAQTITKNFIMRRTINITDIEDDNNFDGLLNLFARGNILNF